MQSFIDQNNLLIGLIVSAIIFIGGTIGSIVYTTHNPQPQRIIRRELKAGTIRVILIAAFFVLALISIFAWQSAVLFGITLLVLQGLKRLSRHGRTNTSS